MERTTLWFSFGDRHIIPAVIIILAWERRVRTYTTGWYHARFINEKLFTREKIRSRYISGSKAEQRVELDDNARTACTRWYSRSHGDFPLKRSAWSVKGNCRLEPGCTTSLLRINAFMMHRCCTRRWCRAGLTRIGYTWTIWYRIVPPDSRLAEARIIGIARCITADAAEENDISRFAIGFRYYIGNWSGSSLNLLRTVYYHGLRP